MAYLTKRFQEIVRKHGGFKKKKNLSRAAITNGLCQKCGILRHYINDSLIHMKQYKDLVKDGGNKDKSMDQVPIKKCRKGAADYVMKKVFTTLVNYLSESEEYEHLEDAFLMLVKEDDHIFNQIFTLMMNKRKS